MRGWRDPTNLVATVTKCFKTTCQPRPPARFREVASPPRQAIALDNSLTLVVPTHGNEQRSISLPSFKILLAAHALPAR
jgi:hypothetical protein